MKYYVFLAFSALMLYGCSSKNEQAPIAPDKMQKILTDMHYAEVYSMMVNDSTHTARNKNNDSLVVYYKTVLNHYHMTPETFVKAVDWYRYNPDILDSVYTHMIPELSVLENKPFIKK